MENQELRMHHHVSFILIIMIRHPLEDLAYSIYKYQLLSFLFTPFLLHHHSNHSSHSNTHSLTDLEVPKEATYACPLRFLLLVKSIKPRHCNIPPPPHTLGHAKPYNSPNLLCLCLLDSRQTFPGS